MADTRRVLRADNYDTLTFDCYGTLIDWAAGIAGCLQPVLRAHGVEASDAFLLRFFADAEPAAQVDGARYADVLRTVLRRLGQRLAFAPTAAELDGFAASVGDWRPFPDTVDALSRLAERFELGIVSNVDNDLFARTRVQLGAPFGFVVTAEDVGCYKPDPRPFAAALRAASGKRILHVAQSVFHDIVPAAAAGLDTVWIARAADATRSVGEAGEQQGRSAPYRWRFDSLAEFADALLGDA